MTSSPFSLEQLRQCWTEQSTQLAQLDDKSHWSYFAFFRAKADEAAASGEDRCHYLLSLLRDITSFRLDASDIDEPFKPFMEMRDRRSASLEDLREPDLDILAILALEVEEPELRARIADVVALGRGFDFRMARIAEAAYIDAARALEPMGQWWEIVERVERALRIGVKLGKSQPPFKSAVSYIESLLDRQEMLSGGIPFSAKIMDLLLEFRCGLPAKYAQLAHEEAHRALAERDWHWARTYFELEARWHVRDGSEEQAHVARKLAAETYVADAQDSLARQDFIAASIHLSHAVEAYRNIGERTRADELHDSLLQCQARSADQMHSKSHGIDFSSIDGQPEKAVGGKPLIDALLTLATFAPLHSVERLRQYAEQHAEDFHLVDLLSSTERVDHRNRVMARKPSRLSVDPAEAREALEVDMQEAAAIYRHGFVHGLVLPAMRQITSDHSVSVQGFLSVLSNNPFVPAGREAIYAYGLHAGLIGDWLVSSHLLIPQMEHSLRYVLLNSSSDRTDERAKLIEADLNSLLTRHYELVEKVFGQDVTFDLKGLLVDRFGSNLRNALLHGQMGAAAFETSQVYYLWWLALRLCCIPILYHRPGFR